MKNLLRQYRDQAGLARRLTELEAEVQECRSMNLRVAELTEVVAELLLPLDQRDGRLLTPPLARGLLPGVLRAELLDSGQAVEADLRAEDLADGFLVGNSVRGLVAADVVA